ncbi:hypothetical protein BGX34_006511 [Mortierella sp. NVP85]|nr:hypothetical protein BGX34_006511 [Mortierella sp. NVP85]
MPKAPRHASTQFGAAAKRPAYQTRSRARVPIPAPTTASAAPGTSAASALTHATASGAISASASALSPSPAPAPTTGSTAISDAISAIVFAVVDTAITASVDAAVDAAAHAVLDLAVPATVSSAAPVSASATAPGPTPVPGLAPAPVVPAAEPLDHRFLAAEDTRFTRCFGSKAIKMFFGIHAFITQLRFGAGDLTRERRAETAGIRLLSLMNRAIGCSYLSCGLDIALWEFALVHDLQGYTLLSQYLHDYRSSLTAADIDVGPGTPDIQQVEEIIGYTFRNKRVIHEALTVPGNNARPDYERLEFLGDSILEVVAATAWIDRGTHLRRIPTISQDTVNNATLTVVGLEADLEAFMRNCPQDTTDEISLTKTSLMSRRDNNKVYWRKDDEVKTLADVVEAVFGAVYLDSGLQLSDVEDVFRRIFWPVVERRMA